MDYLDVTPPLHRGTHNTRTHIYITVQCHYLQGFRTDAPAGSIINILLGIVFFPQQKHVSSRGLRLCYLVFFFFMTFVFFFLVIPTTVYLRNNIHIIIHCLMYIYGVSPPPNPLPSGCFFNTWNLPLLHWCLCPFVVRISIRVCTRYTTT